MAHIYSLALHETRDPHVAEDITEVVLLGARRCGGQRPRARRQAARREAVMELPPERRQALVLRLVNELSAREIGLIMGKSEGAARVLIHRALVFVHSRLAT